MTHDRIIAAIGAGQAVLSAAIGPVLDFVDNRAIVRRVSFGIVTWMLVDAYAWAKAYATTHTGIEVAAVLTAILVPATTLQGFVMKAYDTSRRADSAPAQSSETSP